MIFKHIHMEHLIDDEYRYHVQIVFVPLMLGIISAFMCILNIFTHKSMLMYATFGFAVLCFINSLLGLKCKKSIVPAYLFFSAIILLLFAYFIIFGGTEGFSPVWMFMLPAFGPFIFGKIEGSVINGIMFLMTVFFLWTPAGTALLHYDYTESFTMRFPLVYLAFFAMGYFCENLRHKIAGALISAQRRYKESAVTDSLTGIFNRYWFNERLHNIIDTDPDKSLGLLLIDIDDFKMFNDTYGHLFGDKVLVSIAHLLHSECGSNATACRWGGEEFAILITPATSEIVSAMAERLRDKVATLRLDDTNEIHITISIGAIFSKDMKEMNYDTFVSRADNKLYEAKNTGKNRVIIQEY